MRRWILRLLALAVLVGLAVFFWPFLQSRQAQVEAQQQRFIKAVEQRNWALVKELMDPNYEDQWKLHRDKSLSLAHELLSGFLILNLDWNSQGTKVDGDQIQAQGAIKMSGSGAGLSSEIINNAGQIHQPWTFVWRKTGWKPSDWRLVSISNPELEGMVVPE